MLGHHSLAHELAVALMPEPSAGSKLLAEEFGIEYDDGAEGIDDVPSSARHPDDPHSTLGSSIADSDMPSFADELGASASDASFYEASEPDDHFPQEEFDPAFSAPAATTPSRKQLVPETKVPEQDAMEILAQDLESTDKFLNHLRGVDAEHTTKLSSHHPTKLERLASDVIRKMNESVREREGQVRDLLECEREFRKISGEVGGNEVLGQVDELPNVDDLSDKPLSLNRQDSTSSHHLRHLDTVTEEEQPRSPIHSTHRHTQQHHLSVTDWETDPDRPHLGDEDYLSEEPIASPIKDSFAPPPPIAGPITPASAIPQLSHLRSFTTSLVSSLTTISEQAQVNGAATSEAGRKIRALKNKLGSWRTDWDSAERSRLKIERWEAGIVDSDGTGTPDSAAVSALSSSQRVSKRVDGRQIVAEHLKAFEKALEEASQKTRAIMLR